VERPLRREKLAVGRGERVHLLEIVDLRVLLLMLL